MYQTNEKKTLLHLKQGGVLSSSICCQSFSWLFFPVVVPLSLVVLALGIGVGVWCWRCHLALVLALAVLGIHLASALMLVLVLSSVVGIGVHRWWHRHWHPSWALCWSFINPQRDPVTTLRADACSGSVGRRCGVLVQASSLPVRT